MIEDTVLHIPAAGELAAVRLTDVGLIVLFLIAAAVLVVFGLAYLDLWRRR
jgi:hypothetical protein